jgi:geranylgeranyl reductase family protein
MKISNFDICVVGAGPAGSSAAREAAKTGANVVIIERKKSVGEPVRCAEYIPQLLLGPADAGNDFIIQKIRGMRTILPSGEVNEITAPGLMINRDKFDKALAHEAVKSGAALITSCSAVAFENGSIITKNMKGEISAIRSKIIIGADGPFSTVGRWINSVNKYLIPGIQASFNLVKPLDMTEVYFQKEIFAGYGWVFPKTNVANVGLGMLPEKGQLKKIFLLFVDRLKAQKTITGSPVRWIAGWIPAEPVRRITSENIMLAGDAAGHTHPITGAGVTQAIICGKMAGQWAAHGIKTNNIKNAMDSYEYDWKDDLAESQTKARIRRELMESKWHDLDSIIKSCWISFKEYYMNI